MERTSYTTAFPTKLPSSQRRKALGEDVTPFSNHSSNSATGNFLPFGKRPFGCRPLPALLEKPENIYLVGRELDFLEERRSLLHEAGYKTVPISPEKAILESRKPQLTISVFCHSLTSLERVQLAASFRRYSPESRLLLISQRANLDFEVMLFHSVIALEDGPQALIEAVHKLTQTA